MSPRGWYGAGAAFAALAIGLANTQATPRSPSEIPDPKLTPGVVASTDETEVCGMLGGLSYSQRHRKTPAGLKALVFQRYGIVPAGRSGDWEIDHRVPLALGGADAVYNLWAEPGNGFGLNFTYHEKDALERWAWLSACRSHTLSLPEAQAIFLAPDWRVEFCHRLGAVDADVASSCERNPPQ